MDSIGRCRDCEWWRDVDADSGFGICYLTHADDWNIPKSKSLAYAQCANDGPTYLQTAPGFGCVQFMERET